MRSVSFLIVSELSSLQSHLLYFSSDSSQTQFYLDAFGIIVPGVFFVAIPCGLASKAMGVLNSVLVSTALGFLFVLFRAYNELNVWQIVGYTFFSIYRLYFYSTAIDFILEWFSPENFGTIYGIAGFVAGIVGLGQHALTYILFLLDNNWDFIHYTSAVMMVIHISFPVYLLYLKQFKPEMYKLNM